MVSHPHHRKAGPAVPHPHPNPLPEGEGTRGRGLLLILVIFIIIGLVASLHQSEATLSDYARELADIDAELTTLENQESDFANTMALIYQRYRRVALTEEFADARLVETTLEKALHDYGALPEFYSIRAHLQFKLHQWQASAESLALLKDSPQTPALKALRADLALQRGDKNQAEKIYLELSQSHPSWDNLARLAYYYLQNDQPDRADQLYQQAQQQLSAKQMRPFAWLELQRGIIDQQHGRREAALAHYQRADQAYSGYWLINQHIRTASH